MAGARQIVDPPLFTPTPYGLLSVVQTPTPDGPHWQNGVTYQPVCGDASSTYDECIAVTGTGPPPAPPAFTSTVTWTPRAATPFTVFAEFQCSAVGNNDATQIAQRAMAGNESWQVERSFWTGLAGTKQVVFPHLAAAADVWDAPPVNNGMTTIKLQTAATIVTGGGDVNLGAAEWLGLLEGALADCYNGVGVIHLPQHMAPTFAALGLIKPQGPQMKTLNGNLVAIGAGYPGTSPYGGTRTADETWLYATGAIFMYRSDIRIRASETQSFDKAKNTRTMIAERTYVLGWDCCHYAVQASLGTPKGT